MAIVGLVGMLLAAPAQAQTYPHPISLQGLLLDANDDPISGNYDLTFRIYDVANGGTALWEETHQNVLVNDGLYGVALGLNPNLPPDLFIGPPRHLEVSINGEVLSPRVELRAVPLAYAAKTLTDAALQAGSNVSITRQASGALRIDATAGGNGGLFSVATDATLDGDGTTGNPLSLADEAVTGAKLADEAITSATLADGAVTGAKIADGALVAGQNVTITRQGNGALEVEATGGNGFALPFSGSTSSGGAAFSVENTASGDGIEVSAGNYGIQVTQAGDHGLHIGQANNGVNIVSASGAGMVVGSSGNDGVRVVSAGEDGFIVDSAGRNGVAIGTASQIGVSVFQANSHGMSITAANGNGVQIQSAGQHGLLVQQAATGINLESTNGIGVSIGTSGSNGIQVNQAGVDGIQIQNADRDGIRIGTTGGLAGNFGGDVQVSGTLTKGGGAFKIDHPLDPAGKYLAHSFVESPDMMNVYNGNAVLDAAGEAIVTLPAYFETLNRDFRYQLTAIGAPGPNLHLAEKISGNRFRIAGGTPGLEVSWQVTGIRQDAWANAHRIVVEEDKPAEERGFYLHPRLYGQPETRSVVRLDMPDDF